MLEAPAVIAGLDDVAMVSEPVEHGRRHLGIAEHGRPLAERQVGGADDRGTLVKLADEVEQQLATGAGERQIAELIEDDEIKPGELGSQGPCLVIRASSSSRFTLGGACCVGGCGETVITFAGNCLTALSLWRHAAGRTTWAASLLSFHRDQCID